MGAVQYDKLPFFSSGTSYSAYFAEAGDMKDNTEVQVSGYRVGAVSSIKLDGTKVLVTFKIADNVRLGDRTEAAIKTNALLGTKILQITPRGEGRLSEPIPLEHTTSPYQLADALGDLTKTIGGLDTNSLSDSLATLAQTFKDTPPDLQVAVAGVSRFSESLDKRDELLRKLLANANKATSVLAQRSDQIVSLVGDTNALLASLQSQGGALEQIAGNISALSQTAVGPDRRESHPAQAGAGQAQRGPGHHRQPQRPCPAVDQAAQPVRDVTRRVGVLGPILQRLCLQPAAGPVRPAVR